MIISYKNKVVIKLHTEQNLNNNNNLKQSNYSYITVDNYKTFRNNQLSKNNYEKITLTMF